MPAQREVKSLQLTGISLIAKFKKTISSLLTTNNSRSGFTLIELLVAISIIAIISAVGLVSFSQSQKLARDSKRKQDLRSIAVALELYYQKNSRYPLDGIGGAAGCTYGGAGYCTSAGGDNWIPELNSSYINKLPKDPSNDSTNPWWTLAGYSYRTCGPNYSAPQTYTLTAYLENASDQDTVAKQHYKFCDGTDIDTGIPWWSKSLFVITSNY